MRARKIKIGLFSLKFDGDCGNCNEEEIKMRTFSKSNIEKLILMINSETDNVSFQILTRIFMYNQRNIRLTVINSVAKRIITADQLGIANK